MIDISYKGGGTAMERLQQRIDDADAERQIKRRAYEKVCWQESTPLGEPVPPRVLTGAQILNIISPKKA